MRNWTTANKEQPRRWKETDKEEEEEEAGRMEEE